MKRLIKYIKTRVDCNINDRSREIDVFCRLNASSVSLEMQTVYYSNFRVAVHVSIGLM